MALPALARISPEEYLLIERQSAEKHEYYDGWLIAMAGATKEHLRIQKNLIYSLESKFRKFGKTCETFASDLRVYVSKTRYFYPDITVVCGKARVDPDFGDNFENPEVIVEILSRATRSFDRGEKSEAYRNVPSVKQYIMIDSERMFVESQTRTSDSGWYLKSAMEPDSEFDIAGANVSLSEIYENVFE